MKSSARKYPLRDLRGLWLFYAEASSTKKSAVLLKNIRAPKKLFLSSCYLLDPFDGKYSGCSHNLVTENIIAEKGEKLVTKNLEFRVYNGTVLFGSY